MSVMMIRTSIVRGINGDFVVPAAAIHHSRRCVALHRQSDDQ
jgi:hypothetical protein